MVERSTLNADVAGSIPASPANRYAMRLRNTAGFGPNDSIEWDEPIGVWDTVEGRFVKKNERGEWVPE